MQAEAWITLAILVLVLIAIAREFAAPDVAMAGGLLALGALGILDAKETFAGFANPVLPAIGGLLMVSAGLRETGALEFVARRVLGSATTEVSGTTRLAPLLAAGSAVLNNVTIVALMTPLVREWARSRGLSTSRLLIPMDYATILGSVTTLIGTSTTLVVAALMLEAGLAPMRFFELAPVGLPICFVGLLYLRFVAPHLLPGRRDPVDEALERPREYTAEMLIEEHSPLVGLGVEEAGLRQLPGLFLVEIDRGGHVLTPVAPDQLLEAGDRLVFAGVVETIVDLAQIPGLTPLTAQDLPAEPIPGRRLAEAVVSDVSPLVGRSIRDASFRSAYDAAVIAVHRGGERVGGKIGEIVLRPGDTLLLQISPGFLRTHGDSPDFFLVSEVPGARLSDRHGAGIAGAILLAMVMIVASGWRPISLAAPLAGGLLVLAGCLSPRAARGSLNWSVLVVIGCGLGIAAAMEKTGAAAGIAGILVGTAGPWGPLATLAAVYLTTLLIAEFLNHTAAAAIGVPIAIAAAEALGVDARGFVIAVAFAASCSFANPVSYQTHLIVLGPGGYRFSDFARTGVALDSLCAVVALALIPRIWPLSG